MEALLVHLRSAGAAVNAVKPEYLLTEDDFDRVLDRRAAVALAISPEAEEDLLDSWQVGQRTGALVAGWRAGWQQRTTSSMRVRL